MNVFLSMFGDDWLGVACEDERVYASSFAATEQRAMESLQESLANTDFKVQARLSPFAQRVFGEMRNVLDGKGQRQELAFRMERLPAYTQRVLRTVAGIPVGYVSSYGDVAEAAGGGARAVGNVMASNAFAPLVPCHRVVTSSLGLGGYGGGLRRKFELLKREKRGYSQQQSVFVEGKPLRVFPVEYVLVKLEGLVARKDLYPSINRVN